MYLFIAVTIFLTSSSSQAYAETIRFNVTRDVWISAYPGEEYFNMGAANRLKLKGIQEMALLDFDLSSLKGKKIESARLYIRDTKENNKLRKIGISTVTSPWIEGKSRGYLVDLIGRGATFTYSSYMKQKWAGDRSDLTDVTMGNGNTWQHHTELRREKEMWWSVDIDPLLVQALITKISYGLLVMDESGQTYADNYVFSRESRHSSPYMVVTFSNARKKRPEQLDVELFTSYEHAHIGYGAVVLKIPVKEEILAFDIYINDKEMPLWRIPKPGKINTIQEVILDWLVPEKKVAIKIMAVDELGQRSEPSFITGTSSKPLSQITLPAFKTNNEQEQNIAIYQPDSPFRVWAVPEITKVDPVSGDILSEDSITFKKENPVWSGAKKEITLLGIKGEVIGFQLVVETDIQSHDDLEVKMTPLIGNREIPAERFSLYRVHYLKIKQNWYPELAIPMQDRKMTLKVAERPIRDQKNQAIYIDLSIPSEAEAGLYTGTVSILKNGIIEDSLRINLEVADILMPKGLKFIPELNMYKGPGRVGTERFFNAHRIVHEHRAVINRVPYSQNGTVDNDMIPETAYLEDGQIEIDWSDYDRRLGPLFDGTAFMDGERKVVPVERFYLPFFENWPTPLTPNYKYEYVGKKTQETISRHAMEAPSIDIALTPGYRDRFVDMLKGFMNHFEEKGWNQTEFQFYLNNKWHWKGSSSWWNLDEPVSYDDWMVLRFFGSLFSKARGSNQHQFVFRADISRPQWQRDWLNGILQRMYVSSKAFLRYSDRVRRLKDEGQIRFSVYGSLNDIESSNHQTVLWCMRAFVEGADGVLPWQSLGGQKAFNLPDRNALLVDSRKVLGIDWVVSLRVKALRRCQQNVELMAMLEERYDYNREQIRDFFYRYFPEAKNSYKDSTSSKASETFRGVDSYKMEGFRDVLISLLMMN